VDLITMDLSYLAIADAIGQVDQQMLAPAAQLIALVKPTFELHAATLADQPQQVTAATQAAARALENHGWQVWASSHHPSWEPEEQSKFSSTPHPGCSLNRQMSPQRRWGECITGLCPNPTRHACMGWRLRVG
jgi:hypothetical protein